MLVINFYFVSSCVTCDEMSSKFCILGKSGIPDFIYICELCIGCTVALKHSAQYSYNVLRSFCWIIRSPVHEIVTAIRCCCNSCIRVSRSSCTEFLVTFISGYNFLHSSGNNTMIFCNVGEYYLVFIRDSIWFLRILLTNLV